MTTKIHQCCGSSANDAGSTASRSQTSSATTSSLYLPLAGDYLQQRSYSRLPTSDSVVQDREGFPSAFGLMYLDDSEAPALVMPPPLTTLLRIAAARLIIHLGETVLPPMPIANPCDAPPVHGKKGANQQQEKDRVQTRNVPARTPASITEPKGDVEVIHEDAILRPVSHTRAPPSRKLQARVCRPSTPSVATACWGDQRRGMNVSLP